MPPKKKRLSLAKRFGLGKPTGRRGKFSKKETEAIEAEATRLEICSEVNRKNDSVTYGPSPFVDPI